MESRGGAFCLFSLSGGCLTERSRGGSMLV
jgi:hypothetical protein